MEAPVKSISRCSVKYKSDYEDFQQPRCANILDMVRCMLVFDSPKEIIEAFALIDREFAIVHVKNSFAEESPEFNYRQLLVIVRHAAPAEHFSDGAMLCEIQIQLRAFAQVRQTLHTYYEIYRCADWESFEDFVGPGRKVYSHLE